MKELRFERPSRKRVERLVHRPRETIVHHQEQQILLVRRVQEQRPSRDARPLGDVLGRRRVVALRREELPGRSPHALALFDLVLLPPSHGPLSHGRGAATN